MARKQLFSCLMLVLALGVVTSLGQKVQEGLECDSPIEAILGRTISSTNPTTGTSASPACGMTNDLWFSVKSKCSSLIEFNLCSSNFDTVVAIYDDTEGEGCVDGEIQTSRFLACNDDSPSQCPSNTASSFMTWQSNLNQRFLIRVGGFRGSTNSSGKIVLDINCAGEHQLEDDIVVVPAVLDAGATTKYVVKPANYRDLVTNFVLYSYDGTSFAPLVANVSEPQIITESQIQSQGTFFILNEQLSYTATSILLDDHSYQTTVEVSASESYIPANARIFVLLDFNGEGLKKEVLLVPADFKSAGLDQTKELLLWDKQGLFLGYTINQGDLHTVGAEYEGWTLQKQSQPLFANSVNTFPKGGSTSIPSLQNEKTYFSDVDNSTKEYGYGDFYLALSVKLNANDDNNVDRSIVSFSLRPTVLATNLLEYSLYQGESVNGSVFTTSILFDRNVKVQVYSHTNPNNSFSFTTPTDGFWTYSAPLSYHGTDSVVYTIINVNNPLDRTIGILSFDVKIDDRPRPQPDSYSTPENVLLKVNETTGILANDLPAQIPGKSKQLVHISNYTLPTNGILTLTTRPKDASGKESYTGGFTYQPNKRFNGIDSFNYTIKNENGDKQVSTVTIEITPVDYAPIARNDTFVLDEDTTLVNASVWSNDEDPEGTGFLIATILSYPVGGNDSIQFQNGYFNYTAPLDFNGQTNFTYMLFNNETYSEIAYVFLNVTPKNDPPVANNDTFPDVIEDTDYTNTVAKNDYDVDSADIRFDIVTPPAHTKLWSFNNTDGSFLYSPSPDFQGMDSFVYKVTDSSGASSVANVTLFVNNTNDAPVAFDDAYDVIEGTAKIVPSFYGVLLNDSDVDTTTNISAIVELPVRHGTINLNTNGSFEYQPNKYYSGNDSFTYYVTDGELRSNTAMVNLLINNVNDAPVVMNDTYTIYEDKILTVTNYTRGILGNDFDPDSDAFRAQRVRGTGPRFGTIISFYPNGTFVYKPNANFFGKDSFGYNATDGTLTSSPAYVNIIVLSVNDLPSILPDKYETKQNTPLVVDKEHGLLANDTDPVEMQTLTIPTGKHTKPKNGTVTIYNNGSFVYTPNDGFSGTDTFSYTAIDSNGGNGTALVTIDVIKGGSAGIIIIIIIAILIAVAGAIYFIRKRQSHESIPDGQTPQRLFS